MRTTHNLKKENMLNKNIEGISTSQKFTWENTAKEILNNV